MKPMSKKDIIIGFIILAVGIVAFLFITGLWENIFCHKMPLEKRLDRIQKTISYIESIIYEHVQDSAKAKVTYYIDGRKDENLHLINPYFSDVLAAEIIFFCKDFKYLGFKNVYLSDGGFYNRCISLK